ncbi:MAG: diaminopimelate epimerase [Clostridiales bacterium]|nr:diaminopimelate epimerase [Clostridiales bacterium]
MRFTKMHGLGNDYIYFDCTKEDIQNPKELSIKLSDRHFGVGSDGVILIRPSHVADFRMSMFNADGSEGKMCGNGIRCVGKFVYDKGLTDKTDLTVETLGGIKTLKLFKENGKVNMATVDMGKAVLTSKDIPVIFNKDRVVNETLNVMGNDYRITCVSMGNPHCVTFVKDPYNMEFEKIGPAFENHEMFPERINTEFVTAIDKNTVLMRVWERGSGETWACGTGACATVAACVLNGYCDYDEEVTVKLRGGDLKITYTKDGYIFMTGPAVTVFEGEIEE